MAHLPPLDGSLCLPDVLDYHLEHNPKRPAYVFVQDDVHVVAVTFAQVARAVHRAAYKIRPARPHARGAVVAVIANADTLLYQTVVLACARAGLVPFLVSPRNSSAAIEDMLRKMSCSEVIGIRAHSAESDLIGSLAVPDLVVTEIPTLEELYGPDLGAMATDFKLYPSPGESFDPGDTAFIIHSSGSTGFPKPVPQTFLTALHWMGFLNVSGLEDPRVATCAAMAMPAFHAFGVNFQLLYPLALVKPVAIFPPTSFNFVTGRATGGAAPVFSQPATILRHVRLTCSDVLLTVPSLLSVWRSNPLDVEFLKSLKAVCCSSGPLPRGVGDELVSQGVRLCTSYGATEFGIPTYRLPLNKWAKPISNSLTTPRMVPMGGHDTFELQILTCKTHQPAVENLPDVSGYATCDVVQAHPIIRGLWRVVGRSDDVIVLSSGEKVVPSPLEDVVGSSPIVSGVIMFGRGKPHCGLLIEPVEPATWEGHTKELVDTLWPLIARANMSAPAFSRMLRDMIIVTAIDKPVERVGKGSPARQATLKLYESEIESTYQNFDGGFLAEPIAGSEVLDVETDLFELGFDSISAVSLRAQIVGALPDDVSSSISQTFVYDNPTLSAMAKKLVSLMSGKGEAPVTAKQHAIERMIAKYSVFSPLNETQTVSRGLAVLLTGSTGSLGSHILEVFSRDDRIHKLYLLNRPSTLPSYARQKQFFLSKGLDETLLLSNKIVWLEGDAADVSEQIKNEVNVIIHNAWRLDFNLSLSSYEPLIRSTHALLNLARTARHRIHFVFASSVSAAQNWDTRLGPVPEEILDTHHALGKGYGESKYVAEVILQKSQVAFTALRIGQIAGGTPRGAWAVSDWVPSMVRTSIEVGALPAAVGNVSWIPMPAVAQATLDAVLCSTPSYVLNIVHPHPIPWTTVMRNLSMSMTEHGITKADLPAIEFKLAPSHEDSPSEVHEFAPHQPAGYGAWKWLDLVRETPVKTAACGIIEGRVGGNELGEPFAGGLILDDWEVDGVGCSKGVTGFGGVPGGSSQACEVGKEDTGGTSVAFGDLVALL
ncbi:hypothetical protein JB92DRAFT_3148577 [Gautieria morchelliformis]|nr:hypothetical protein JB92DRAFT_3148577 [Gautieria morchelliformis]